MIERVNERRMEEGEREKIQYNKDKKREEEKRRGGGCVKAICKHLKICKHISCTGLTQSRDSRSRARRGIKLRNESEPESLKAGIESEHVNRITSFITRDRSKWE